MDPVIGAALISGGSSLFGSALSFAGQERANAQNKELFGRQLTFNAQEAAKQRQFERDMFSTRYQMTRKDLETAGYNPLLAVSGGVSNSPHGSAASSGSAPKMESSGREAGLISAGTAKLMAEYGKTRSEQRLVNANARIAEQEANLQTSDLGRKLRAFQLFMDRSGIGRAGTVAASAFGLSRVARYLKGALSFSGRR